MKTIVVFVDYSKQSRHAARYAIHLARKINANVLLSDAISISNKELAFHSDRASECFTESPSAENERLLNLCNVLENELEEKTLPGKFSPAIYCQSKEMQFDDAVNYFQENLDIAFMICGVNLYYGESSLLVGEICGKLLALVNCPVILVPEGSSTRYAEKYAFVADINCNNLSIIREVSQLAEYSAAELMLVNINNGRPLDADQEAALKLIMKERISQIEYGRIYYRHLPNSVLKSDVEWLMQDNWFETLVVVNHRINLINSLLRFDFTSKIIGNINTPLIIYPPAILPSDKEAK